MRNVTNATLSAANAVTRSPTHTVSHGEMPCTVVKYADVYAPSPTNAACPNDVSPATPVSNIRPMVTSEYSAM